MPSSPVDTSPDTPPTPDGPSFPVDLSILVISYNTKAMTLECLASVFQETTRTHFEVVVLDNASTDGSVDAIRARHPAVRLIASQDNLGFAQGNNVAAQQARGRYLLLLNPDTVVLEGAIDKLMDFARQKPEARIWGGRTLTADRKLNPSSCWRQMTLWNLFCRAAGLSTVFPHSSIFNTEGYGGWRRDSVRAVDIVTGCFLLITTADWNALGGFDRRFFMYGEEADLCLRAAKSFPCQPLISPEPTIVHYGGASETVRASASIKKLAAKSELIRRHFPPQRVSLALLLLKALPATRLFAYSLAAVLAPARFRATRDTWRTVWAARSDWLVAYQQNRIVS